MRRREEMTHVWVRTDVVEAVLKNGGGSLPQGWKPSRKRGRSESNNSTMTWGWARAHVVHSTMTSPSKSEGKSQPSKRNYSSPFGHVKLRKVSSPTSTALWNSPERRSPSTDNAPLTVTVDDPEFAPPHLQNETVTLPRTVGVGDERVVYNANSWWHCATSPEEMDVAPEDLTSLTHLHEPAVVYCLKRRYEGEAIYTYTGKVLLALNPFRTLNSLYGAQVMRKYCTEYDEGKRAPPHIYATAQDAYGAMMRALQMQREDMNTNQSILVSGESGAGKTVTTKIIMRYLATLSRSQLDQESVGIREDDYSIESQVLQSNPILESFGNARTIRNDNSSRFGKFIEIQFLSSGCLACASIETYLLEKVRLITQAPGERNYHIFYEILAGASLKEKRILQLTNKTARDFQMTSLSGTFDRRDGVEDRSTYRDLIKALDTVGFSRKEQMELLTVASALLHASNLTFVETDADASSLDESNHSLNSTLSLMGVSPEALNNALCTCAIEARGETLFKTLSIPQAKKALDALVKATYGAMFTHIVRRVNSSITVRREATSSEEETSSAYIGVLDIFGFESFDSNSFEQLCINYCNEALQQQFNRFVFKLEQKEYEDEGIEWSFITFPDNQDVLDVIDKKHTGILSVLDEQCRLPRSTDSSFARATYETCSHHPRFQSSNTQQVAGVFSVLHYAGPVEYDTLGFREKNTDELPKETTDLLIASSHPLLPGLGRILREPPINTARASSANSVEGNSRRRIQRMPSSIMRESVGSQFSRQLHELRDRIDRTTPHYVRCLKPNDDLIPNSFHPLIIADQLCCAGVLEAIRVSRVGFPQRYAHDAFVQRYRILAMKELRDVSRQRYQNGTEHCNAVVATVARQVASVFDGENIQDSPRSLRGVFNPASVGIQMGRTKVFLRRRAFDSLELLRNKKVDAAATKIQSVARMCLAGIFYSIEITAVLVLQSFARRLGAMKKVRELRRVFAAVQIQCAWRRRVKRKYFLSTLVIVKWCQSRFRGAITREIFAFLMLEHKSHIIQRCWRRHVCFHRFNQVKYLALMLQCLVRRRLAQSELNRLKREAKDLDAVTAERDRFREESARLKRELERTKQDGTKVILGHLHGAETNKESSAELERLRKEVERLQNGVMSPPTTMLVIPSDASDHVDDLQSLASECAQKDRELQLLRQEVASLRAKGRSKTSVEESIPEQGCKPYTGSLNSGTAYDDATCHSPGTKQRGSRGILSPFRSLLGTVCRANNEQESPSQHVSSGSSRAVTSTSLLDDDVGGYGAHDGPTLNLRELQDYDSIQKTRSHDDQTPGANAINSAYATELLLHRAASDGDTNLLRDILRTSPNSHVEINDGDLNGRTPLHLAALTSNLEITTLLLEEGAVANSQDHDGCTPLHLASNPSMSALLLEKGRANPNIPNLDGVCALHLTVRRRDVESIKSILSHGANVNAADDVKWFTALHLIAQAEENEYHEVDEGLNSPELIRPTRRRIAGMLCAACDPCRPDLNYQDSKGNTPLHHAAMLTTRDACDLFSLFLEKGGDPNIANQKGQTILHLLCHNDALRRLNVIHEILHLVLFYGADPNRQTSSGCTALHLSLYNHDIDSAIQLTNSGAELHLVWKKPKNWTWVWENIGSEITALDMVEDEHSLHRILAAITKPQEWAPSRSYCMHCRSKFGTFERALHCRHCGSLVCGACSHRCLGADLFPKSFGITDSAWVCTVCEKILMSRKEETDTQPNSSIQEDSEDDPTSLETDITG